MPRLRGALSLARSPNPGEPSTRAHKNVAALWKMKGEYAKGNRQPTGHFAA